VSEKIPDTGSSFMQRLGYYILGIALGLMILGWFQIQKMQAKATQSQTDSTPSAAAAEVRP
jgi:hypothetical protein